MNRRFLLAGVALAVFLFSAPAIAANVKPLAPGSPAPDFDLPGVDGRNHRLADFNDAKLFVVLFTCNHCPTAQAYEDRVNKLYSDYRDKGVALVAISPNDPKALRLDELGYTDLSDTLEEMKVRAKDKGFEFPYLYDGETQKVSLAYGALATPHVFVFDAERKLRYQGRIDDAERDASKVKSHDLRVALDALLAGKAPPVERTNVFGCATKWSDKRDDAKRSLAKWDAEDVTLSTLDAAGVKQIAAMAGGAAGEKAPQLRLVNVWATWCGPCVAEMPELTEIHRQYRKRGVEVVTISMDTPDAHGGALDMLRKNHLSATNYRFAGEDKDALVAALDVEWQGPVPHTLLIAPGGKVLYRETGAFDALKLRRAIVDYMGRTYGDAREKAR